MNLKFTSSCCRVDNLPIAGVKYDVLIYGHSLPLHFFMNTVHIEVTCPNASIRMLLHQKLPPSYAAHWIFLRKQKRKHQEQWRIQNTIIIFEEHNLQHWSNTFICALSQFEERKINYWQEWECEQTRDFKTMKQIMI